MPGNAKWDEIADAKWEKIAEEAIAQACSVDCDLKEFYRGLKVIRHAIENRLECAVVQGVFPDDLDLEGED